MNASFRIPWSSHPRLTSGRRQVLALALLHLAMVLEAGPFDPGVGDGSAAAVRFDDPRIVAWANGVEVSFGTELDPAWTDLNQSLGPAGEDATTVMSLGRGGEAVFEFPIAIIDRDGPDFAVFENAFNDFFLELAYVEVSSDGIHFQRFPTESLTAFPVPGFGSVDPTAINGLAGKYRGGYGTPFDLADLPLKDRPQSLDTEQIRYVRLVDVVGDGSARDSEERVIYDPYPTVGSSGFDVDGIAVFHTDPQLAISEEAGLVIRYRHNPDLAYRIERWNGEEWQAEAAPLENGQGRLQDVVNSEILSSQPLLFRIHATRTTHP